MEIESLINWTVGDARGSLLEKLRKGPHHDKTTKNDHKRGSADL